MKANYLTTYRQVLSPAIFFMVWFVFHLILSHWATKQALSSREAQILFEAMQEHWPTFIWTYTKVAILHLFAGLFLGLGLWVCSAKRAWPILTLVSTYIIIHSMVRTPQLFDEFPSLSALVRQVLSLGVGIGVVDGLGVVIVGYFGLTYLRNKQEHSGPRHIAVASYLAVMVGFLFFVQKDLFLALTADRPSSQETLVPQQKNIILIGVDGLRPGTLERYKKSHPDSPLARFLHRSNQFNHVISPIARTHAAYASLFTSQNPVDNDFRFNLDDKALNTDTLLKGSPLSQIKRAGYTTSLAFDAVDFAYFDKGEVIDRVMSPAPGFHNNLLPLMIRNRPLFALFNNAIGRWFLPEIIDNAAFRNTHKAEYFTSRVTQELGALQRQKKPFFFVSHNSSLHWPGSFPYPYYKIFSGEGYPYFSYSPLVSGWNEEFLPPNSLQLDYFRELYNRGLDMVTDLYLNPLLTSLESLGLLNNSLVILFSDHGETLFDPAPVPLSLHPEHGSTLLFQSDSNRSVLYIYDPEQKQPRTINDLVGLIDIMPTILDELDLSESGLTGQSLSPYWKGSPSSTNNLEDRYFVAESAYWPRTNFLGQTFVAPRSSLWTHRVSKDGKVYIDPEVKPLLLMQKQRAVYQGPNRLTVYPTVHGYRAYLSHRVDDPMGIKNELYSQPQVAQNLLVELLSAYKKDIDAHNLPQLQWTNRTHTSSRLEWDPNAKTLSTWLNQLTTDQYLAFQKALEATYFYHDYTYSERIWMHLLSSQETPTILKAASLKMIYSLCAGSTGKLHRFNLATAPPPTLEPDFFPAPQFEEDIRLSQFECLSTGPFKDALSSIKLRLEELSDESYNAGPIDLENNSPTPVAELDTWRQNLKRYQTLAQTFSPTDPQVVEVLNLLKKAPTSFYNSLELELAEWEHQARSGQPGKKLESKKAEQLRQYDVWGLGDQLRHKIIEVHWETGQKTKAIALMRSQLQRSDLSLNMLHHIILSGEQLLEHKATKLLPSQLLQRVLEEKREVEKIRPVRRALISLSEALLHELNCQVQETSCSNSTPTEDQDFWIQLLRQEPRQDNITSLADRIRSRFDL